MEDTVDSYLKNCKGAGIYYPPGDFVMNGCLKSDVVVHQNNF